MFSRPVPAMSVGVSQSLNEKVMSEHFAALNARVTSGAEFLPLFFHIRKDFVYRHQMTKLDQYLLGHYNSLFIHFVVVLHVSVILLFVIIPVLSIELDG